MPSLGSAPRLASINLQHNPLTLDVGSVDRLAAEAPNLQRLVAGGTIAAAARLTTKLPSLNIS